MHVQIISTVLFMAFFRAVAADYLSGPIKSGDGTFYDDWKRSITSCGKPVGSVGPNLCALSSKYMDVLEDGSTTNPNPNTHPLCSAKKVCVLAWNASKGDAPPSDALELVIEDRCAGCKPDDVDIADDVFERIAPKSAGRVPIKWKFIVCGSGAASNSTATSPSTSVVSPSTSTVSPSTSAVSPSTSAVSPSTSTATNPFKPPAM